MDTDQHPETVLAAAVIDDVLGGGYIRSPREALFHSGLSVSAKMVYLAICDYYDLSASMARKEHWPHKVKEPPGAFPGNDKLAEACEVSLRTVITAIKELRAGRYLIVHRRGQGRTNIYHLTGPDQWIKGRDNIQAALDAFVDQESDNDQPPIDDQSRSAKSALLDVQELQDKNGNICTSSAATSALPSLSSRLREKEPDKQTTVSSARSAHTQGVKQPDPPHTRPLPGRYRSSSGKKERVGSHDRIRVADALKAGVLSYQPHEVACLKLAQLMGAKSIDYNTFHERAAWFRDVMADQDTPATLADALRFCTWLTAPDPDVAGDKGYWYSRWSWLGSGKFIAKWFDWTSAGRPATPIARQPRAGKPGAGPPSLRAMLAGGGAGATPYITWAECPECGVPLEPGAENAAHVPGCAYGSPL